MGRELKRKQEKKDKGNVKENNEVKLFTVSGFIRTVAGIVFVLFIFYFITFRTGYKCKPCRPYTDIHEQIDCYVKNKCCNSVCGKNTCRKHHKPALNN